MINIVIPMAGRGSRFAAAGYTHPKPLIPVGGKPMIQWVVDNVRPTRSHRFIFICLAEHLTMHSGILTALKTLCPGCAIVPVDSVTEGAACTVLLAREIINTDDPLMIVNADQFVDLKIDQYLSKMDECGADGLIMTFWSDHPKWSYCLMRADGLVSEVVEKRVVSNEATVGIYNFRRGSDYVRAAEAMIAKNLRVNNEFYVAPSYNELIQEGKKIAVVATGREYDGMYGLGVPDDLEFFKTTTQYAGGSSSGDEIVKKGSELIHDLSVIYAKFFNSRNLAGLTAMFEPEVALEDPIVQRIEGRISVMDYVKKIYSENKKLTFRPLRIFATVNQSVIEFELGLDGNTIKGVDVIDWSGRKIKEIHAYLNPS